MCYVAFYSSPKECYAAVQSLGIPQENTVPLHFDRRTFPTKRQEILDTLLDLRDWHKPKLVLCPSSYDVHQDHQVIHNEALRAFKTSCSIWGYEHPWNNFSFSTGVFVQLKNRHIEVKINALRKYESQQMRPYLSSDYVRCLARVRGTQINCRFAEAFELLRMVI